MKDLTIDTRSVSAHETNFVTKQTVNALTEQVNNLQKRYYRTLAPDCAVRTAADRWYLCAIATACVGLVFPPRCSSPPPCAFTGPRNQGRRPAMNDSHFYVIQVTSVGSNGDTEIIYTISDETTNDSLTGMSYSDIMQLAHFLSSYIDRKEIDHE